MLLIFLFVLPEVLKSIDDARSILNLGADKISINTPALENPKLINQQQRIWISVCGYRHGYKNY